MKKLLLFKNQEIKAMLLLGLLFLFSNDSWGQTTVFSDDFGVTAISPYTGGSSSIPSSSSYTASTSTAVISTILAGSDGYLNMVSNGTAGRPYLSFPISSLSSTFNPKLSENNGPITWSFNMKTSRATVMSSSSISGYADGSYYSVFILCSNSINLTSNSNGTNGYAVIYQRSSIDATKNGIRLVKFTNGLLSGSSNTPVGPSTYVNLIESGAFSSTTSSKSVKVVYIPSTGTWELLTREDPTTTFVDPLQGTLISAGTSTDSAYTSTTMLNFGLLSSLSTSTSAANSFQFDNIKISITPVIISNYYYSGSGELNNVNNWTINSDGSGASIPSNNPTSFNLDNQNFIIKNSITTSTNWIVSGVGSKIILGDPLVPGITLTIANGYSITGTIDITAASSGTNSVIVRDVTNPSPIIFGVLNINSEVHLQCAPSDLSSVTFTTNSSFGKLFIDGTNSNITISGNPTIKSALTLSDNNRLFFSGTSSFYTIINSSATISILGYLKIGKVAGLLSTNVTTPGSNLGTLQFNDSSPNLIIGSSSTIEYSRSTLNSNQVISQLPTGVNYNNLLISDSGINCTKSFAGPVTVNGTFTINQPASTLTNCGFLTLANGATFTRTAGSLDAAPTFGSSVNVNYNGTTATTASFEIPTDTSKLNNLTINNTAGVTLSSATSLNGKLNLSAGLLTTGNYLTLKSTAMGTASVTPVYGTISGNVTVERYIPAKRAWRALTSPVNTTTSISANWQEAGTGNGVNGFDIWSNTAGTGILQGGSGNSLLEYYSTGNWIGILNTTDTNSLLSNSKNKPFMAFVTGPYGSNNVNSGATATTIRATGALFTGNQTYANTATQYSFIGNPYASPLDPALVLADIDNAAFEGNIWVWDANATGANSVGTYNLFNNGTYSNVTSNPAITNGTQIQSGQAFFVKSTTGGTFTIKEAHKGTTFSNAVFRSAAPELFRVGLYKQVNNEWSGRDGAMTVILSDASANQSPNKMANSTENIAFTKNGTSFASNHHLPLVASDVLNVKVWNTTVGANYKLKINTEAFTATNLSATLEDLFTNSRTPLTLDGSAVEYPFTVTTDALSSGDRFRIVFQNAVLGTTIPTTNGFQIVPNPVTGDSFQVNLGTLATGTYSYSICNAIGQEVEKGTLNNATQNTNYEVKMSTAATGIYVMKIKGSDNSVFTAKIIKK